jgi:hypothetical protein
VSIRVESKQKWCVGWNVDAVGRQATFANINRDHGRCDVTMESSHSPLAAAKIFSIFCHLIVAF